MYVNKSSLRAIFKLEIMLTNLYIFQCVETQCKLLNYQTQLTHQ